MGTTTARRLIDSLCERGCDYTLLFHLRNPGIASDTCIGKQLQAFLKEHQLSLAHFDVSEQNKQFIFDFFTEVRREFVTQGITGVNSKNFIVTMNKGGKAEILKKYAEIDWPKPCEPYCMQTMGSTGGVLFFMFQSWRDALIMQKDLLEIGGYIYQGDDIDIEQVYEHQWAGPRTVSLMIDWEIMLSQYGGRKTLEQVEAISLKFPEWLVGRLKKNKVLPPDCTVECVVKNKSRAKGKDYKISKHFLFNIRAVTLTGHFQALSKAIEPFVLRIKEFHTSKTLAHIPNEDLDNPVWGWDNRLLRGQNGIGTLFGRKKGEVDAPLPSLDFLLQISPDGESTPKKFSWNGEVLDTKHPKALSALYRCSFSVPQLDFITYNIDFVATAKVCLYFICTSLYSSHELDDPLCFFNAYGYTEKGRRRWLQTTCTRNIE